MVQKLSGALYLAMGAIMQQSFVTLWGVDIDFPLCRTVGTFLWSKPSTQILTCNFEISLTDSGMELKAPLLCLNMATFHCCKRQYLIDHLEDTSQSTGTTLL